MRNDHSMAARGQRPPATPSAAVPVFDQIHWFGLREMGMSALFRTSATSGGAGWKNLEQCIDEMIGFLVDTPELVITGDGQGVRVGTNSYSLTETQGQAFLVLYRAYQRGVALKQEVVLKAVGCGATRLVDIFKRGADGPKVWRYLIVQAAARGTYTLDLRPLLRG